MNKTPNFENSIDNDDLLNEYDFDYQKARPNRFINSEKTQQITVVLDPDVAQIFKTSQDVNNALRIIISAIPN